MTAQSVAALRPPIALHRGGLFLGFGDGLPQGGHGLDPWATRPRRRPRVDRSASRFTDDRPVRRPVQPARLSGPPLSMDPTANVLLRLGVA